VKYFNPSEAEQSEPEVHAAAGSMSRELHRPVTRSRGTEGAKMVLSVYGMNYPAIDTAVRRVEQLCQEAEKSNVIRHADIGKLTTDQVTE